MKEWESKIKEIAEKRLPNESLFLVEVKVAGRGRYKVSVAIDGDKGVKIEDCTELSLRLGDELELLDLIDGPYELEVSSPGVGEPLLHRRQFHANVGRKAEFLMNNGNKHIGKIEEVTETDIGITEEIRELKKKKVELKPARIAFADLKETRIMVSFK